VCGTDVIRDRAHFAPLPGPMKSAEARDDFFLGLEF
jgi:hypothetical protein